MSTDPMTDRKTSLATQCVVRLLERHGIPERGRHARLMEATGHTYGQVRRRMTDESDWSLEELRAVAENFGETLETLVSNSPSKAAEAAVMVIGSLRVPCSVWLGNEAQLARPGPLVATRPTANELVVVPAAQASGVLSFEVERLVLGGTKAAKLRHIAVLDDDRDLAQSIAQYLIEVGFKATTFYTVSDLAHHVDVEPFDGYVVDWLVKKETARTLIAAIRKSNGTCPIVVLTGQVSEGHVAESELTSAAAAYRLQFLEKPIRTSVIVSALEMGLERPAAA
jgi:ActR/RegA family two-component response regulator